MDRELGEELAMLSSSLKDPLPLRSCPALSPVSSLLSLCLPVMVPWYQLLPIGSGSGNRRVVQSQAQESERPGFNDGL